jgi:hypothetical protein
MNEVAAYWKRREETRQKRRAAVIEDQRQAERERDKEQEHVHHEQIVATLERIHTQNENNANRQEAKNDRSHAWERRRFWLDVAAIIVAACAACLLLGQMNVLKGQLREMKTASGQTDKSIAALEDQAKALKTAQRAWISPGPPDIPPNLTDGKGEYTEIRLPFENMGNEPALKLREEIHVTTFKWADWESSKALDGYWNDAFAGHSCKDFQTNAYGRAISPKAKRAILEGMSKDDASTVTREAGVIGALIMACLTYETIGEVHSSSVCVVLEPMTPIGPVPQKYRANYCAKHNEAD